jgi:glycosyltransferase involved in cell wall biosynthesis
MNILQLISSTGFFGAENVVLQLSEELYKTDYKPYIGIIGNAFNSHFEFAKALEKNCLKTIVFDCGIKFDIRTILQIRHFLKENEIRIIHTHGYKATFYGLLASMGLETKKIATCHNWLSNNKKMKFYEYLDKLFLRKFDKVIAVSDILKNEILMSGITRDKVIVINNGVDVDRFQAISNKLQAASRKLQVKKALGIGEDERVVGTVGRLSEEKGHIYLLQAFEMVTKEFPNIKLLLVGDGALKDKLQAASYKLHLENKVIFTGARNDIPELLNAMDIFVLPSLVEAMPMALLEAMASIRPIIATNVGSVAKLIKHNETGILIAPGDPVAIKNSIIALLRNSKNAFALAEKSFENVRDNFSSKNMVNKYISLYEKLMN